MCKHFSSQSQRRRGAPMIEMESRAREAKPSQVKSSQVKSSQVKSSQVKSSHKSSQVKIKSVLLQERRVGSRELAASVDHDRLACRAVRAAASLDSLDDAHALDDLSRQAGKQVGR